MFTKGPWEIDAFNNIWSEDTDICKMSLINEHADGYRDKSTEEHLANAHLIAAAPDQNECLHSVKKTLEHYLERLEYRQTGNDPKTNGFAFAAFPDWELRHTIELINDVLNKAEGKS